MNEKDVDYYLKLPYTIEITRSDEPGFPGFAAKVKELPGCLTQADTFEALGAMIEDAMRSWIGVSLEDGLDIPEPKPAEKYSGKFVVRLPRSLHRHLVETAEAEDVSLNAYVSSALAMAVGKAEANKISAKNQVIEKNAATTRAQFETKARAIMILNGAADETDEISEERFSNWLNNYLDQARIAAERAEFDDALQYIHTLQHNLGFLTAESPQISTNLQMLEFLENQILRTRSYYTGLLEEKEIKQRVFTQVMAWSKETLKSTSELRTETYSQANRPVAVEHLVSEHIKKYMGS